MTGKENLLLDEISCEARHIQNHIYGCDGSVDESVECIVANCNSLEKIFNELKEENTKYKRAFEILKEKLHLKVIPCSIFEDETKKYLDYDGDYRKPMTILDNEEAELIEELMKDA